MMCVRTYVSVTLRNVEVTSRWNVAVSRLRAYEFGMSRMRTYSAALAVGARSRSLEDLARTRRRRRVERFGGERSGTFRWWRRRA